MPVKVDVAIIGAGLAGLSAANAIRRLHPSASIIIMEAHHAGFNNPSPLTFSDIIEQYELQDCVNEYYSEFAYHNNGGSSVTYTYGERAPFAVVDYRKACDRLLRRICATGDSSPLVVRNVVGFVPGKEKITLHTDGDNSVETGILIDCSGKAQVVASHLMPHRKRLYSHVHGAKLQNVSVSPKARAYYLLPHNHYGSGGGWYYPFRSDKASFGYATIAENPDFDKKPLMEKLMSALQDSDLGKLYLKDVSVDCFEFGSIPVSYVPRLVFDNILIAGDAGGMATSWTCMGVEPALVYGECAGKCAADALLSGDVGRLRRFQDTWDRNNKAVYDQFARFSDRFWKSDFTFWEWILKNDLRHLNPRKGLERMRNNKHLITPMTALIRTAREGVLSRIFPARKDPRHFYR